MKNNKNIKNIWAGILSLLLIISGPILLCQTEEKVKDEMGLTRMKVVYPAPGSEVSERRPMIAADFSALETPVDAATVVILLNGADVTSGSDVTPSYVLFQPVDGLIPGPYEVRITAKNIDKQDLEPLAWTFTIEGAVAVSSQENRDNTTGRLKVSVDHGMAHYTPQLGVDVSDQFREKEGTKLNTDFTFSNISEGRIVSGTYHRETQAYTDIEIDKGKLYYADSNFSSYLGHFWTKFSDLTVIGTELAGARIDIPVKRWKLTAFSGRSQDPSTSGTFKQNTSGLRGSYNWRNTRHTTSITALAADESSSVAVIPATQGQPARDRILSLLHEYRREDRYYASLELAGNERKVRDAVRTNDEAGRLFLSAKFDQLYGEAEIYSIDDNYLPVAEGTYKYLKSNRKGGRVKGKYDPLRWLSTGGEYEQYDSKDTSSTATALSPDITTKRGNAFVAISPAGMHKITYRHSKLTTTSGTDSESDSVIANLIFPSRGNRAETRFTAGWQDINYAAAVVNSNTEVLLFSFNTGYRDRISLSTSYTTSETESLAIAGASTTLTDTENNTFTFGLNWNIIPLRLSWSGKYEQLDNSGTNVDTEERRLKTLFRYVSSETYTFTLGWDNIDYSDAKNTFYNYDEDILRAGAEVNF